MSRFVILKCDWPDPTEKITIEQTIISLILVTSQKNNTGPFMPPDVLIETRIIPATQFGSAATIAELRDLLIESSPAAVRRELKSRIEDLEERV